MSEVGKVGYSPDYKSVLDDKPLSTVSPYQANRHNPRPGTVNKFEVHPPPKGVRIPMAYKAPDYVCFTDAPGEGQQAKTALIYITLDAWEEMGSPVYLDLVPGPR